MATPEMAGTQPISSDPEGIDGVRMTWNAWPRTKVESSKCLIPIAASISPIHSHPEILTLPYAPLRCKTCVAALNPFCLVDFTARIWICPFCFQRNHFPPHYFGISETNLPAELLVACSVLNLFTKDGKIKEAKAVFEGIKRKDLVCWTTMVNGFAKNGEGMEAIETFRKMQEHGLQGDGIVMLALIQA